MGTRVSVYTDATPTEPLLGKSEKQHNFFFFFLFLKITVSTYFTFGCSGSSLLHGLFSSCSGGGYARAAVHGLLLAGLLLLRARASAVAARGLSPLWLLGSRAQAQGLRHTGLVAFGIFPDRGSKLHPLHRQTASLPLSHQEASERRCSRCWGGTVPSR